MRRQGFALSVVAVIVATGAGVLAASKTLPQGPTYRVNDGRVQVFVGRPGTGQDIQAYTEQRHALLMARSRSSPEMQTKATVTLRKYNDARAVFQFLETWGLTAEAIYAALPGYHGVVGARVWNNDIAAAYDAGMQNLEGTDGSTVNLQLSRQAAEARQYRIYAIRLAGHARSLAAAIADPMAELVDPHISPEADSLAKSRGLRASYIDVPLRPDQAQLKHVGE